VRLRDATPGDTAAVAALEQALFSTDAWSEASVAAELAGPGRQALVAVEDGTVVGYVVTLHGPDVVDLQRIGVDPRHRRRGTATALLDTVLSRAGHTGADRVLLEVSAVNSAALAFYTAAGFVEIDRRRRYYRDGSDAVVMRRSLGRGACVGRG
jgi:ribosomal-protein-alanine N-acetyltransferase